MSMKRFRVAGHSMAPTLLPGEEVVAVDTRPAQPGNIVVFPRPGDRSFWLIKRLADETGWVTSDNPDDSRLDSRTLGRIPVDQMLPVIDRFDSATFEEACRLLAEEDEHIAAIIGRWGLPEFWHRSPGFQTLTLLILEQQVSLESGAAMYRRLTDSMGPLNPEAMLAAGYDHLRSLGVTRQKSRYLIDLADGIVEGALDLEGLDTEPVENARKKLMALRGVGAWTADAYLLSALRRPDMWPVGDRALQIGAGEVLGLSKSPTESELEIIGEPWRPVRAAAARLIWHDYLSSRGRTEPPDPTTVHMADPGA